MAKSSKTQPKSKTKIEYFVFEAGREGLAPDRDLTVSQWADSERVLSNISSPEPGPWRTERVPYMREIMDALTSTSPFKKVVFMKGSQIAGTEAGLNWIGYCMDVSPGPMLYILPNMTFARDYSNQRLGPMIDESPALKGKVRESRAKKGGSTILRKEFPMGTFGLTGAETSAAVKGKPVKYLFMDEVDEYPKDVKRQGSVIKLAEVRTRNFRGKKIYICSSPTIKGASNIEHEFEQTDKRYYFVPCTSCSHMQRLVWAQVKWESGNPKSAHYECIKCGHKMQEYEKQAMLANGEWRATATSKSKDLVGYHLSALYSPVGWLSWSDCVEQFLEAKEDRLLLKVFVNTVLGETFEERGDAPDWEIVAARRETYQQNIVPNGAVFLTAGVDVQKDRLEMEIVGWGRGKTTWSVAYRTIWGNPDDEDPGKNPWEKLDSVLMETFEREDGGHVPIHMLAIDSSAYTMIVYDWARRHPPGRVMAVKGMDGLTQILRQPKFVDIDIRGKRIANGVRMWGAGVSMAKMELYTMLRLKRNADGTFPPGYMHFPAYDDIWFQQMCSEQLVTRTKADGTTQFVWILPEGKKNEALDCRIYNRMAAAGLSLDRYTEAMWDKAEEDMGLMSRQRKESLQKRITETIHPAPKAQPDRISNLRGGQNSRGGGRGGLRPDWHDDD